MKKYPSGLLVLFLILISLYGMDVSLSNYPTYFYGHYCELEINVTLPATAKKP